LAQETLFDLPTTPEEISVELPLADLRRLDFSALEFSTARRALIEYIQTYYPDEFNDFVANNGLIMVLELVAYMVNNLSLRADILADEGFLPTAQTFEGVDNHLQLINQRVKRQTSAIIDVACLLATPLGTDLNIPAGYKLPITAADGLSTTYEVFRAPGNWSDNITIPAGKQGVVAYGIEGEFSPDFEATSLGGVDQTIQITDDDILDSPIIVTVDNINWTRVSIIEKSNPNDEVYEIQFNETGMEVIFGDNKAGKAPLAGQQIVVRYRTGGGTRGQIGDGFINQSRSVTSPAGIGAQVTFRNLGPSRGGVNSETLETAKKRAPREAATHNSATSGPDYATLVAGFSHPVYGTVSKSVATVRTSRNANIVELFVLALGESQPVSPSVGLKKAIETYFSDINVLTDQVDVLDGAIKPVDLDMTVVVSRNAQADTVKTNVEAAIDEFFSTDNFDMGVGFSLSQLEAAIQNVDGVGSVRVFKPTDDIIKVNKLGGETTATEIGINEFIILGDKNVRYYLEKGPFERS